MLKIGMPTLIETDTLQSCAILCHDLGLQFIELNMNLPQYQPDTIDIPYFREIADMYNISYTMHLDENFNASDFNTSVRQAYINTMIQTVDIAKMLDIHTINLHLSKGVYFTLPHRKVYLFEQYIERYLNSIDYLRKECEKAIGKENIRICIENTDGFTPFQIQTLEILLSSNKFFLTFDVGHNHTINGADETIITNYLDKLCHIHLHDATASKNHLPLGNGEINLEKYLSLAQSHNCSIVLETKTIEGLLQSVNWLKTNSDILS